MSQTPTTPNTAAQPAGSTAPAADATRSAAAKALMGELERKTKQVIQDNPDVLKGVAGGIAGVTAATPK